MLKFTFYSLLLFAPLLALHLAGIVGEANTQNIIYSPEVKNGMRRALREGLARFGNDVNHRSLARPSPLAAYRGAQASPAPTNRFLDQPRRLARTGSGLQRSGSRGAFPYRPPTMSGSSAPDKLATPLTAIRAKSAPAALPAAATAAAPVLAAASQPVAPTTSDRYVSKAQESLLEAEEQIAKLQGVLVGEQQKRAALSSRTEVGALRKALEEQMKSHKSLEAEHAKLKAAFDKERAQLRHDSEQAKKDLEREQARHKKDLEQLKNDLETEKKSKQRVEDERRKLLEDHSALTKKLAEFDKIKSQGEQIEALKRNLEEEIRKHTAKIGQLETSQAKLQEELRKETKLRADWEEERRRLKEDHRKLGDNHSALDKKVKELTQASVTQQATSLRKEQDFGAQRKRELEEQKRKCDSLLNEQKSLQARQVDQLRQQLAEARQVRASLEEALASSRSDANRLATRAKQLESAIAHWGLPVPAEVAGDERPDEALNGVCVKRGFVTARSAELNCQCDMGSAVRAMQRELVVVGDKTDMAKAMQEDAIRIARRASKKSDKLSDIVAYIKSEFEKRYGLYWQCVAGTNLDFFIVWNYSNLIDFRLGQVRVLLFKTEMYSA